MPLVKYVIHLLTSSRFDVLTRVTVVACTRRHGWIRLLHLSICAGEPGDVEKLSVQWVGGGDGRTECSQAGGGECRRRVEVWSVQQDKRRSMTCHPILSDNGPDGRNAVHAD